MRVTIDGNNLPEIVVEEDLEPNFSTIIITQGDNKIVCDGGYMAKELIRSLKFISEHDI